ncbi:MAG TPA: LLM class flavin-dependent oxidoreductase [Thermoanaerobaculia bacterium]|nr:LLM class flavin-dependent oxidoreductase [Thermoanaerobaculia bacterium]
MLLSVLDQAPISEGSTGAQAVRNSVDLAQLADRLGYTRYWVAEHHGTPALACASPEALIGPIAMATSRIKVGSGGVMLPHYSPVKVAETFSMLSALAPGRIDLGLGRAAGTDPVTTFALQRDRRQAAPDDFPAQLYELLAYLDDEMPADHPFARLSALPGRPDLPEVWLLGSSAQSGLWAAELGLPYAFADFINPQGAELVEQYRAHFEPSRHAAKPRVIAAVWALCADTDEEARRIASSAKVMFTLFLQGQLIAIPPIDKALAFLEHQPAGEDPFRARRRVIVGSPKTVRAKLEAVAAEYAADELMIVTITYDHDARRRSYELIAKEML